jgi:hypothetical protein
MRACVRQHVSHGVWRALPRFALPHCTALLAACWMALGFLSGCSSSAYQLPAIIQRDASVPTPTDAGSGDGAAFDATSAVGDASAGDDATCARYCSQVVSNCRDKDAQYVDLSECLGLCGLMPHRPGVVRSGNSIECRNYHSDDPARTAPARYCAAAGILGAETCGGRCESFCVLATSLCSAQQSGLPGPFKDYAGCMQNCVDNPGFPVDKMAPDQVLEAAPANTLNCRARLLGKALRDPGRYCLELGASSVDCR